MKKCKDCGRPAKRGNYCYGCISRKRRERNPLKVAYYKLKSNAKRRGKEFDLTFDQFKNFAIKTSYCLKRGRTRSSYHIDRIDENRGYTIDNIQVLTNKDNVIKYKRCRCVTDELGNKIFYTETVRENYKHEQCPF